MIQAAKVQGFGITWLCSVSSVLLLLSLVALAVHVRVGLGRWPEFGERYHTSTFQLHQLALVGIMLFTVYGAPLLWTVALCFRRLRLAWKIHLIQAIVYGVGWLLIIMAGEFDPTPFTNWFLD